MSRIGRQPVLIPKNVEVKIKGRQVVVKGPNGELTQEFHPDMKISRRDGEIIVERPTDNNYHRSLHGLTRALIANMVEGVTDGFQKQLEIRGVGYRAQMQGRRLVIEVGYSHPVEIESPEGITIEVGKSGTDITVRGADKQLVGEIAAKIRDVRPPEPYKGKGIRYKGEHVRRKPGKAGKVGLGM